MGMFDQIRLEVPLPDTGEVPTDIIFQTKDLGSMLDNYLIAEDGHLYREVWDYEWVDDESMTLFKGRSQKVEGSFRREIVADYHGDIPFYHDALREIDGKWIWHEYVARFTDGKLSRISVVETPLDN
jgi:hypothetical protein